MDSKFTEVFDISKFVNCDVTLDEVLHKFENERKIEDLVPVKKSYTVEEFLNEFPKSETVQEIKDIPKESSER